MVSNESIYSLVFVRGEIVSVAESRGKRTASEGNRIELKKNSNIFFALVAVIRTHNSCNLIDLRLTSHAYLFPT